MIPFGVLCQALPLFKVTNHVNVSEVIGAQFFPESHIIPAFSYGAHIHSNGQWIESCVIIQITIESYKNMGCILRLLRILGSLFYGINLWYSRGELQGDQIACVYPFLNTL